MSFKKLIYKDKIERVIVLLNREDAYWDWRPEITFLWGLLKFQREGFYFGWDQRPSNPLANKNLRVVGQKVYYKPHILLRLASGEKEEIYFNTEVELYNFIKEEDLESMPHIKIIR
jgi:hypothetical protein